MAQSLGTCVTQVALGQVFAPAQDGSFHNGRGLPASKQGHQRGTVSGLPRPTHARGHQQDPCFPLHRGL